MTPEIIAKIEAEIKRLREVYEMYAQSDDRNACHVTHARITALEWVLNPDEPQEPDMTVSDDKIVEAMLDAWYLGKNWRSMNVHFMRPDMLAALAACRPIIEAQALDKAAQVARNQRDDAIRARQKPRRAHSMKFASDEAKAEIWAEERGEKIASEMIEKAILALKEPRNV